MARHLRDFGHDHDPIMARFYNVTIDSIDLLTTEYLDKGSVEKIDLKLLRWWLECAKKMVISSTFQSSRYFNNRRILLPLPSHFSVQEVPHLR